jgi:hypothetical protein
MLESKLSLTHSRSNGSVQIVPIVRISRLRLPFFGLIWSRPEAVQVQNGDDALIVLRVRDRTRIWQIGLTILFTMTGSLIFRLLNRSG